jgi:hypothetical protein
MTHEEVYIWLIKLMVACLWVIGICAAILVVGGVAGYATEKYAQEARCINSACDKSCKVGARFVRHQGCEVTK